MKAGILNFCPRYIDLLDYDRVFNETGVKLRRIKSYKDRRGTEGLLTIKQIFDYTPSESETVAKCVIRDQRTYKMVEYNQTECFKRLIITKYFTQQYMCYFLVIKDRSLMRMEAITKSTIGAYMVWEIFFTERFATVEHAMAVTSQTTIPTISRHYSSTFNIRNLTTGELQSNVISMRSRAITITTLPKPYDTACLDINFNVPIFCHLKCLSDQYVKFGRAPATELIEEKLELKPLADRDLKNKSLDEKVEKIKKECRKKCSVNACNAKYGFTLVQLSRDPNYVLSMSELTPLYLDFLASAKPGMVMVEYFSFLMSCFGAWFGMSFLTLDPFSWKSMFQEQFVTVKQKIARIEKKKAAKEKRRSKGHREASIRRIRNWQYCDNDFVSHIRTSDARKLTALELEQISRSHRQRVLRYE